MEIWLFISSLNVGLTINSYLKVREFYAFRQLIVISTFFGKYIDFSIGSRFDDVIFIWQTVLV